MPAIPHEVEAISHWFVLEQHVQLALASANPLLKDRKLKDNIQSFTHSLTVQRNVALRTFESSYRAFSTTVLQALFLCWRRGSIPRWSLIFGSYLVSIIVGIVGRSPICIALIVILTHMLSWTG